MKKILGAALLLGVLVATLSVASTQEKKAEPKLTPATTVHEAEVIAQITKYRAEAEQKLLGNKFTRKEVALTGAHVKETIKQKWEKMDAYYDGAQLVRIQLYPHKGISGRTEEFYLIDNELVFAFIQDQGPKHEGKDAGEPGKEFYFHDGKIIKFDDRSGEPRALHADQEKKMYELRLPYEVVELREILKQK